MSDFVYFGSPDFSITDFKNKMDSDRVIYMTLFDLANNAKLLSVLKLAYLAGNYGNYQTYESRGQWFAGYLSAFHRGDRASDMREKMLGNPTIGLLVTDEDLLAKIKKINGIT